MGAAQDLVRAGYGGYQGWGDAEASADFNAGGGKGKWTGGGSSGGGFNFDFEQEAKNAYGELGTYYDRLLREAKGNVNLAFTRLDEDYSRGERYKRENLAIELSALKEQERNQRENLDTSLNRRGLLGRSSFAEGLGISGTERDKLSKAYTDRREAAEKDISRYLEQASTTRSRSKEDMTRNLSEREFELEQQRRKEAAELANIRGDRAYRKFSSQLV